MSETEILSDYVVFETKYEIKGMALKSETDNRIDIINLEGRSHKEMLDFIHLIKKEYNIVYIWQIVNQPMERLLLENSFIRCTKKIKRRIVRGVKYMKWPII